MPKKILVIDDDEELRPLLAAGLRHAGYEVHTAENGEAGLAAAKTLLPDMISVDVNMPKMNGFEFCKAIRADAGLAKTKIMILTGKRYAVDERFAYSVGADTFMVKPYKLKELLETVAGLLSDAPPGPR